MVLQSPVRVQVGVKGFGDGVQGFEALRFKVIVNPRKLEHRFRMIHAGIPFTLL